MGRSTSGSRADNVVLIVLMNLVCYTLLIALTLVSVVVCWPILFLTKVLTGWSKGKCTRLGVWVYGRLWLWTMRPFVRFSREGFTPELANTPSVMVVNHQSFFDTYFMGGLPIFDIVFAVRSWPFKMFWFKPVMELAQYLDVESLAHYESEERATQILASGSHVLFYPEGHRSRDGKLGRFYSGAFRLAKASGAPVVPLCISGSGTLLPPGRWWFRPARVKIKALAPVDPNSFEGPLSHRELMNHVRTVMAQELEQTQIKAEKNTVSQLPINVAELLPHRPPMLFVDRLVHYEEGFAKLEAGPWETHLFADDNGVLDPLALLEMMAQSYAAARGYDLFLKGEDRGGGFLVGVRDFKVHSEACISDALRTEVRETDTLESFHLADAAVYRGEKLLVEGSIRVWTPPTETIVTYK